MTQNAAKVSVIVYLVLVTLSAVPIFTGEGALSGIFSVVLTLPWIVLISRIIDLIKPAPASSVLIGVVAVMIGAAINSALIYLIMNWITAKSRKN